MTRVFLARDKAVDACSRDTEETKGYDINDLYQFFNIAIEISIMVDKTFITIIYRKYYPSRIT